MADQNQVQNSYFRNFFEKSLKIFGYLLVSYFLVFYTVYYCYEPLVGIKEWVYWLAPVYYARIYFAKHYYHREIVKPEIPIIKMKPKIVEEQQLVSHFRQLLENYTKPMQEKLEKLANQFSEEQEIISETKRIYQRVLEWVYFVLLKLWEARIYLDLERIVIAIAILLVIIWWYNTNFPWARNAILKMRGVYIPEAIINGTNFTSNKIPDCQIAVYKGGVFCDSFVGFAIRISNEYVAMPLHVYKSAMPNPILANETKGTKVAIGSCATWESRSVSDLIYIRVLPRDIAQLCVQTCRLPANKELVGFVVVTGRGGMSSTNELKKHSTMGLLEYYGSTLPGFSGAAYTISNVVYGMHLGAAGNVNLGLSYVVWLRDMQILFSLTPIKTEGSLTFSSPSMMEPFEETFIGKSDSWGYDSIITSASKLRSIEDLKKLPKKYDTKIDWAADIEEEGAVDPYDFFKASTVAELEQWERMLSILKEQKKAQKVVINGESDDNPEVEITSQIPTEEEQVLGVFYKPIQKLQVKIVEFQVELDLYKSNLEKFRTEIQESKLKTESQIKGLEDRILQLEMMKPTALMKATPGSERYWCSEPGCTTGLRTVIAYMNHIRAVHKKTEDDIDLTTLKKTIAKPESLSSDESQVVGGSKPNFYGSRPISRVRFRPRSRSTSKVSEEPEKSPLVAESLKSMENSMQEIKTIFAQLARSMSGPSSEQQQN